MATIDPQKENNEKIAENQRENNMKTGEQQKDSSMKTAEQAKRDMQDERDRMSEHREQLAYDFRELKASAEALLSSTRQYTGAEIQEARERLQEQLNAALHRSEEMGESVCDMKERLMERADECVHRHPWKCISVAFLLGLGTAHCMRR